jgi:hypothetical protein
MFSTRRHALFAFFAPPCFIWVCLLLIGSFGITPATAQSGSSVFYAGGSGQERFNAVVQLSDGTVLVGGAAQALDWLPAGTPTVQLAPMGIRNNQGTGRIAFLLQLSADMATVLHVVHLPANAAEDISFIRTTNAPGTPTGDLYISGTTRDSSAGGYFIARLNSNFVNGIPSAFVWARSINATGDHQTRQPWDVGGDGKVVYAVGAPFSRDWAAVYRLRADGTDDVVEDWRYHWGTRTSDGATVEGGWTPASSRAGVTVQRSGVVFKVGGRCDLRSWTNADYSAVLPDGNGATRQGRYPLDLFFSGPCDPNSPTANGPGYTGYRMGANPTQRIGGIAVDRRSNHIYIGFSVQSTLPDGNPDFEPGVIAYTNTGALKWWSRLYTESAQNSPPDQYVDGLTIDYSADTTNGSLVVLARTHGNAPNSLWNGVNAFQNRFTGTSGNIHISWLGKLRLSDGVRQYSTYVAEYVEGSTNFGAAHPDPNIDGFPNPNAGWPNLNTTRCETTLHADLSGAVYLTCVGRRTITTRAAYQKMPLPGNGVGTWNDFVRVYSPTLNTLVYSSLLTGNWDQTTGSGGGNIDVRGVFPTNNGVLVVGFHPATSGIANGVPMPTANIPAWGSSTPANETGVLARLLFSPPTTSATLDGTVTLQGRSAANLPLRVRVGSTDYVPTTNASGVFALASLTPGSYTIRIKHAQSLAITQSATLNAGANTVVFPTLRMGDVNDDNTVSLTDFSILATTFNRTSGQPGYDTRADLNGDGAVTLADFSLLASNFNEVGQ